MSKKSKISGIRITELIDKFGWNQSELARKVGVTPQAVQYWAAGRSAPMGDNLAKLSEVTGMPEYWFFMKDTNEINNISEDNNENFYRVDILDISTISELKNIKASDIAKQIKAIEYENERATVLFGSKPAANIKIINMSSDSMSGTLEPGDLVFIDISKNDFDSDGMYIFSFGENIYVKRLQMVKEELLVISDNPKYREWSITTNDHEKFNVIGKVLLSQSQEFKRYG